MAKRILKILAGLVLAAVLLVPGVALFVDDETLLALLEDAPVLGRYTAHIVPATTDLQARNANSCSRDIARGNLGSGDIKSTLAPV